jgi:hypothetical protein
MVRLAQATALVLACASALAGSAAGARGATPAARPSDFNGDGYADLAIGAPYESRGGIPAAGSVNVVYGSSTGLTSHGDQSWSQDTPGVKGRATLDGGFGEALASGDFDRDGYADLAIGAPSARVGSTKVRAGAVHVLYGSHRGLAADRDQRWTAASIEGHPLDRDRFGMSLAVGDFDRDGYADLAIGAPDADLGSDKNAGMAVILRGGTRGLAAGPTVVARAMTGAGDNAHRHFGGSMAAGDLDGDGFGDLVVGAAVTYKGGSVGAFYGSPSGLASAGSQLWSPETPGIDVDPDPSDRFGWLLAVGDFDADGNADLAVSSVFSELGSADTGVITIVYGTAAGLGAERSQRWDRDTLGFPDGVIGSALAAGDFDGNGYADLAIGAEEWGLGGTVVTLTGSVAGLSADGSGRWSQDSPGVPGAAENEDVFGRALTVADYGRSDHVDLAIGAPGEDIGKIDDAGTVDVLYGGVAGLSGSGAQAWSQASDGVAGTPKASEGFGQSLSR